ncbi:MAG TPA: ATP-dependent DNA helicase RecG [Candidatus Tyrphobacter sp.]|nr:ATP-dependent DNA helicase RecG [Candidatus Tyrphobacter sp.]
MPKIPVDTPLSDLPKIGPGFLSKFKRLGIETAGDLIKHFPGRYEDWSEIAPIADLKPGDAKTIQAEVKEIDVKKTWRRRMFIVEAILEDASGPIKAVWFNQPYIKKVLQAGAIANFSGKTALRDNELYLSNPTYEKVSNAAGPTKTKHTGRLVPIYPETRGLTSRGIRYFAEMILENLSPLIEFIPPKILRREKLPELNRAFKAIHFPKTPAEAAASRKRFAFEELFLLQLTNIKSKLALAKKLAPIIKFQAEKTKEILSRLPFELTLSQKKSLWEILQDLESGHPMNRLLQGDVGSGKTIVAGIASVIAAEAGFQVALMAPTEILARQHYQTLKKFFGDFELGLGLLVSKEARAFYGEGLETDIRKEELIRGISLDKIKIIVGTHALIQESVKFKNPGLVIIDEQHRFGVKQRAALSGSRAGLVPHFLSMSATPIPRTLMMAIFGDLDVSIIKELPHGRKPIISRIVPPESRVKAYEFIRSEVKSGRQVFVICPRIEIAETEGNQVYRTPDELRSLETKTVKEEYEKLREKTFPDLKVAMLHGRMKGAEKEKIMRDFKDGKIDILVSTSVVEVGVDVPNATVMMIESADRFGLAQLYQFKGRVGRGEYQSYCLLFTDSESKGAKLRLHHLITAKNGFELAEKDLATRGPGEFLGETQAGLPDVAMRALKDAALVKSTREAAEEILKSDPELELYPALRERISSFEKELHLE